MKKSYILDSREQNPYFHELAANLQWAVKALRLSDFIMLPPGKEDLDCGDFTDDNHTGIVEFKEIGDFVSTFYTDGGIRGHEQVIKMYSTGLPFAIIIHGDPHEYLVRQARHRVEKAPYFYRQARFKIFRLCYEYHFGYVFVDTPQDAIVAAKSFLEKCTELPRRMPVEKLYKDAGSVPKAMLMQVQEILDMDSTKTRAAGIGPETAEGVLELGFSIAELGKLALEDEEGLVKRLSTEARDCGPVRARAIVDALLQAEKVKET